MMNNNFINFLIANGYIPFRKVYDKAKKAWVYIQDIHWEENHLPADREYFSSLVNGCMDLRLIKDGKEIVWGIPGMFAPENSDKMKVHHPTLIYPNVFGSIEETDRAFDRKDEYEGLTNEKILEMIESRFKTIKTETVIV